MDWGLLIVAIIVVLIILALIWWSAAVVSSNDNTPVDGPLKIFGALTTPMDIPTSGSTGQVSPPILYNGGPVTTNPQNIYLIWYGNWNQSTNSNNPATIALIKQFINDSRGSAYYAINKQYTDGSGFPVVDYGDIVGEAFDNYSKGSRLQQSSISTIVLNNYKQFNGGNPDPEGVYMVMTSSDVTLRGFGTTFCGFHSYVIPKKGSVAMKYIFVGNPANVMNACSAQALSSPNNNSPGDAMISIIAHEIDEVVTDPLINAWYDVNGLENADKCAWTFGDIYQVSNGSYANVVMNGNYYLVQRNLTTTNYCSL